MSKQNQPYLQTPFGDSLPGDLGDDLRSFMCTRMDHLDPRQISPEYASLDETASQLYERLEGMLADAPHRLLLNELYETYNNMSAMATEMYYQHGFLDGMRMIIMGCKADGK